MTIIISVGAFILAIGILITFHEFGHYWVARKLGVEVLCFSIGFGRPLFHWHGRDGTRYQIAAIPLGGYVKMLDENEGYEIPPVLLPRAFNRQSLAVRSAIVAAGPLANFLLALILTFLMYLIGVSGVRPVVGNVHINSPAERVGIQTGDEILAINTKQVRSWQETGIAILKADSAGNDIRFTLKPINGDEPARDLVINTENLNLLGEKGVWEIFGIDKFFPAIPAVVNEVTPNGSADRAGLQSGDRIVAFDNEVIDGWSTLVELIKQRPAQTADVVVERPGGDLQTLSLRVDSYEQNNQLVGRIGVQVDAEAARQAAQAYQVFARYGAWDSLNLAVTKTWDITILSLSILWRLLTGEASLQNLSGPVTIAQVTGISIMIGIGSYLSTLALLSVSIGILNLLPIPMLDGGHLLYYLIEWLKGSPVSLKVQLRAQMIGVAMIAGIMFLALYNDIYRLLN